MELETVNKLYLELSQFSTAKTAQNLRDERTINDLNRKLNMFCDFIESGNVTAANVLVSQIRRK